jgi:beta-galactosidase
MYVCIFTHRFCILSRIVCCRHVDSMYTPYIFPQECGGRVGVHWLHLADVRAPCRGSSDAAGPGLAVAAKGGVPMQISLSPYSLEQIAAADHQHELPSTSVCHHLHIDAAHMGVGGDDSWSPTVHAQFLVEPRVYSLHCCIQAAT